MIRILIADDHKILREGIRNLLVKLPNVKVVGEAENDRLAWTMAKELKPDVVIMDVSMPELNGIEATRHILADLPETKILALSMYSDSRFVTRMLHAGAAGYLLKDCAFEELKLAIRTIVSEQPYLSPSASSILIQDYLKKLATTEAMAAANLTPREREVLQNIAEGRSTRKIAEQLHISVKTVETHRKQIMHKLDLHSIADLTKYAIREGMTTLLN